MFETVGNGCHGDLLEIKMCLGQAVAMAGEIYHVGVFGLVAGFVVVEPGAIVIIA